MAAGGRRKSGKLLILVAVLLIIVLAAAVFLLRGNLFPQQQAQDLPTPSPRQDLINIVVLAQPVTRGTTLTEGMLATIAYPQGEMVEGLFFTDVQQVISKQAKYNLEQGVPLTPSLITSQTEGSPASFEIDPGKVAISIPISSLSSVAYGLQARDHVNVIAAMSLIDLDPDFQTKLPNITASVIVPGPTGGENSGNSASALISSGGAGSTQGRTELDTTLNQPLYVIPSEPQRSRLVSQTLVQDAIVLWVGEFPANGDINGAAQPNTETTTGENGETVTTVVRPELITLIVSPQDAVTLNYMMLSGAKLNLALRSASDTQQTDTEAVTLQFIMDQYKIPYPAKLPYGIDQGTSNETVTTIIQP